MEFVLPQNAAAANNVPAFLAKLWKMVDDPETNHLIEWNDEGHSFLIHNQAEFAQSLLPYYYKHSNMASFVRQLNMYGFHKVVGVDTGGLKSERQEEMEFAHDFFRRGMEFLLDKIKRKVSNNKATHYAPAMKSERVNEVLNEVSVIKDRQEDLDGKLDTMKKENEALWREVVTLRHKHQSQQKIVNKLIQFLVGMVQPRMGGAVKRRYPNQLAIQDTYPSGGKEAKLEMSGENSPPSNGPIIRDVTHESQPQSNRKSSGLKLNTSVSPEFMNSLSQLQQSGQGAAGNSAENPINVELPETPEPQVSVPSSTGSLSPYTSSKMTRSISPVTVGMEAVDPKLVNPAITSSNHQVTMMSAPTQTAPKRNKPTLTAQNLNSAQKSTPMSKAVTPTRTPNRPTLTREISREDIDTDMTMTTKDLDNLKDILSGQITLDPNLITNIFNPEDSFSSLYPNMASDFPLQFDLGSNDNDSFSSMSNIPAIQDASGPNTLFGLNDFNEVSTNDHSEDKMMSDHEVQKLMAGDEDAPVDIDDSMLNTPKVVADNTNPISFTLSR